MFGTVVAMTTNFLWLAQQAMPGPVTARLNWTLFAFLILLVAVAWFVLAGLRGRKCRFCRKRNRPQAVFCAECGHRLIEGPPDAEAN